MRGCRSGCRFLSHHSRFWRGGFDFFLRYRRGCSQVGALLKHELDDARQRGIVAQLKVLVARNVIFRSDGREHLRLFHGVDAEVRFEVEIQVQHVLRIAGLLDHQCENAFLDGIAGDALRGCRSGCRFLSHHSRFRCGAFDFFLRCRRSCSQVRALFIDETDHVRQGGVIAQLAVLVARNVVSLADGGKDLRLLNCVDAQICFEIEVQIKHVHRITGFLGYQSQHSLFHRIALEIALRGRFWRCGRSGSHSGDLNFGCRCRGCDGCRRRFRGDDWRRWWCLRCGGSRHRFCWRRSRFLSNISDPRCYPLIAHAQRAVDYFQIGDWMARDAT